MENETNVSVAVIEPTGESYAKLEALDEHVLSVAKAKPDLIIIPRYPFNSSSLIDRTYQAARQGNPHVAIFTQTQYEQEQYAQRIDPWTQFSDKNPLRGLNYKVKDFPCKGGKDSGLDMLVLFGGERADRESPAFESVKLGGFGIWVDKHGNHEFFHKQQGERGTDNNTVFGNDKKNLKNCSWYDLKF